MPENSHNIPPFEGFAEFYDQFMLRLVNYPAWVDYIIRIFKEYKLSVRTMLDVACGTGIPSLMFAKKGYQIIGVDASKPMLEIFREKIAKTDYNIRLINADMRNFAVPEKTDTAVSLYDSVNYLLTEQDLLSCFRCVANSLKAGGIFVFDMNTICCLESFWGNRETPRQISDIYSIWRNAYNPETRISKLKLTVFTNDGRTFEEIHQERGYTETEIISALTNAGFNEVKFYKHLTFLPTDENTLRMMIVARCKSD